MGPNKITKCKGCGMPIFFRNGTPYYAKKVPVLIKVDGQEPGSGNDWYMEKRAYVSHFINCPNASDFTKRGESNGGKENTKASDF